MLISGFVPNAFQFMGMLIRKQIEKCRRWNQPWISPMNIFPRLYSTSCNFKASLATNEEIQFFFYCKAETSKQILYILQKYWIPVKQPRKVWLGN
jgi:hypothetical protein